MSVLNWGEEECSRARRLFSSGPWESPPLQSQGLSREVPENVSQSALPVETFLASLWEWQVSQLLWPWEWAKMNRRGELWQPQKQTMRSIMEGWRDTRTWHHLWHHLSLEPATHEGENPLAFGVLNSMNSLFHICLNILLGILLLNIEIIRFRHGSKILKVFLKYKTHRLFPQEIYMLGKIVHMVPRGRHSLL